MGPRDMDFQNSGALRRLHDRAEIQLKHEAQKIGKLGALFGTRDNAVLYITGAVIIIVLCLLGALMFVDETLRPDIATTIGGIGLAALGYLGGQLKK